MSTNTRARLTRSELDTAIDRVERSRLSHVQWRDHLAGGCEHCAKYPPEFIQTLAEHEQIIDEYDQVLDVLRRTREDRP